MTRPLQSELVKFQVDYPPDTPFVFLFPKENDQCQRGVNQYRQYLGFDNEDKTGFYPRYLENFLDILVELSGASWAIELRERYLGI